MTAVPPGWYPDPYTSGTSWRWWDGQQWGAAPFAPNAYLVTDTRERVQRFGNWLRYALIGFAAYSFASIVGLMYVFGARHGGFFTTDANGMTRVSSRVSTYQIISAPLSLLSFAFLGLLIAWIYQAGGFAEAMGWPTVRSRTLGAFSVLIPIVNFWWPYEAIRDSYPPGASHRILLRWWLSYLLIPFATFIVAVIAALTHESVVIGVTVAGAAVALCVPVVFGWQLIADLDNAQRASLS